MDFSFHQFCQQVLEEVGKRKRKDALNLLGQAISEFRESAGGDVFPMVRLLLPKLDRARAGSFLMQESKLASLYIDCLNLARQSEDSMRLTHWKKPGHPHAGDFSMIVYEIVARRFGKQQAGSSDKLTIRSLNEFLDNLASSKGSAEERQTLFRSFISSASALEQKWTLRIILRDLKINMGEASILKLINVQAPEYANVCGDLKLICEHFNGSTSAAATLSGGVAVETTTTTIPNSVIMFSAFRPMLAAREASVEGILKAMPAGSGYFIETKLDGVRIQLHKRLEAYKYFTRNGNDYTPSLGHSPGEGSYTPLIHSLFKDSVKEVILDGEMMVYDTINREFVNFGTLSGVAKNNNYASFNSSSKPGHRPCLVLFDILWLNGKSLVDEPLFKRVEILRGQVLVEEISESGLIEFVTQRHISDTSSSNTSPITDSLDEAITNCQEGIVIKASTSRYDLGSRSNSWFKLKPEYIQGLIEDLDLLVVGANFGKRNSGKISTFFLGILGQPFKEGEDNDGGGSFRVIVFGKVGSGYSYSELEKLRSLTEPNLVPFNPRSIPDWLDWSGGSEKPDLIIKDPKKSQVFCIRATEIVPTEKFAARYTMRFPRFMGLRHDKSWYEILDLKELMRLMNLASGKMSFNRGANGGDVGGVDEGIGGSKGFWAGMKRKQQQQSQQQASGSGRTRKTLVLSNLYTAAANLKSVTVKGNLFAGKQICVFSGDPIYFQNNSKQAIEICLAEQGAEIVQNPRNNETFCILSGEPNGIREKGYIKSSTLSSSNSTSKSPVVNPPNLVNLDWLYESMHANQLLPFTPRYLIWANGETQAITFKRYLDPYGDYYEDLFEDCEQLDEFLNGAGDNSGNNFGFVRISEVEAPASDRKRRQYVTELDTRYQLSSSPTLSKGYSSPTIYFHLQAPSTKATSSILFESRCERLLALWVQLGYTIKPLDEDKVLSDVDDDSILVLFGDVDVVKTVKKFKTVVQLQTETEVQDWINEEKTPT